MPEAQGEQYAVIFDSQVSPQAPIASGNTNVQSIHFDLRYARTASIQFLSDGGAKVNWQYQVTNLPLLPQNYMAGANQTRTILGATARDDSFASVQWSTVQSGSLATGSQQGTILTLASQCNRVGRVTLQWDTGNTGGTAAKVLCVIRNMGFS